MILQIFRSSEVAVIGMTYGAGIGGHTGPIHASSFQTVLPKVWSTVCVSDRPRCTPHMMEIAIFYGGCLTANSLVLQIQESNHRRETSVSIISWLRPTPVTYFPGTPIGNDNFSFFNKGFTFHRIQNTLVIQSGNIQFLSDNLV